MLQAICSGCGQLKPCSRSGVCDACRMRARRASAASTDKTLQSDYPDNGCEIFEGKCVDCGYPTCELYERTRTLPPEEAPVESKGGNASGVGRQISDNPVDTNKPVIYWSTSPEWRKRYNIPETCPHCGENCSQDGFPDETFCRYCWSSTILSWVPLPRGWVYPRPSRMHSFA